MPSVVARDMNVLVVVADASVRLQHQRQPSLDYDIMVALPALRDLDVAGADPLPSAAGTVPQTWCAT